MKKKELHFIRLNLSQERTAGKQMRRKIRSFANISTIHNTDLQSQSHQLSGRRAYKNTLMRIVSKRLGLFPLAVCLNKF